MKTNRRDMLTQSAALMGLLASAGLLPQAAHAAWTQAAFAATSRLARCRHRAGKAIRKTARVAIPATKARMSASQGVLSNCIHVCSVLAPTTLRVWPLFHRKKPQKEGVCARWSGVEAGAADELLAAGNGIYQGQDGNKEGGERGEVGQEHPSLPSPLSL